MNIKKIFNVINTSAAIIGLSLTQLAFAQATTTPGTPTTSLGGMLGGNILMLIFSVSLLVAGGMFVYRSHKMSKLL